MAQRTDPITAALWIGGLFLASKVLDLFDGDAPPRPDGPPPPPTDAPTLTDTQLQTMAGQLVALLTFYVTEDEQQVVDTIARCNTDGDIRWLSHYYGDPFVVWQMRRMNLAESVAAYLDPEDRATLNARLRAKGITFEF